MAQFSLGVVPVQAMAARVAGTTSELNARQGLGDVA